MYEAKPPRPGAAPSLQAVSWADLSARLAAARDLRQELADDDNGEGSFDAASARWIADHAAQDAEGKPDVNSDDLGNRKAVDGMDEANEALPLSGGRGTE